MPTPPVREPKIVVPSAIPPPPAAIVPPPSEARMEFHAAAPESVLIAVPVPAVPTAATIDGLREEILKQHEEAIQASQEKINDLGRLELEIVDQFDAYSSLIEKIQRRPEFKPYQPKEVKFINPSLKELTELKLVAGSLLSNIVGMSMGIPKIIGAGILVYPFYLNLKIPSLFDMCSLKSPSQGSAHYADSEQCRSLHF